jgi:WD40 repeat protein
MVQQRFVELQTFISQFDLFHLQLWDPRRKGFIFNYKGHNGAINALKFSPDGRYLITASDDTAIRVKELFKIY